MILDEKFLESFKPLLNHYKKVMVQEPNIKEILNIIGDKFEPSYFPQNLNEGYYKELDTIDRMLHMKVEEYRKLRQIMELSEKDLVLDFGSGLALLGMMYHKTVKNFYCYDPNEIVRNLVKKIDTENKINYITDLESYKFDKIFCRNVIGEYYHADKVIDLFKKFYHILNNQGRIAFNFHTPQSPYFVQLSRHSKNFIQSSLSNLGFNNIIFGSDTYQPECVVFKNLPVDKSKESN